MTPLQRHVLPKTLAGLVIIFAGVALLPETVGTEWRSFGVYAALWALAVIGLDLSWGIAGQASLGQQGFVAVGAFSAAVATTKWGWNLPVGILFAIAVGCLIALLIGRIVLRLAEVYLALATLAFGMMIPVLTTGLEYLGKATGLFGVPRLELPFIELTRSSWYWFAWALVGIAVVVTVRVARSMTGLGWRLIAENQQVAEALGVPTRREKEKAFMVSAGFAAVAGALYASFNTAISPAAFGTQLLLIFIFALIVGGRGTVIGPVVGTMGTMVAIIYSGRQGGGADLILGLAFVLALFLMPLGFAGLASGVARRVTNLVAKRTRDWRAEETPAGAAHETAVLHVVETHALMAARIAGWRSDRPFRPGEWGRGDGASGGGAAGTVEIRNVSKSFGGLHALTDVTMTFEPGIVHGIVGPNGAGKSTLLAVASGVYAADAGEVVCFGERINDWPAWKRSRRGMSRTFQAPQLAGHLTVLENVAGGMYPVLGAGLFRSLSPLEGRTLRQARGSAEEALETLGIAHLAQAAPLDLSFGQQRLVELARALVRAPAVLWLDEPASGLDQDEKDLLSTVVTAYARSGAVVGFIEHDTELVAKTCDVATVLDSGRVVHHGSADSVFEVDLVRELYMGTDDEPVADEVPQR